MPSVIRVGCRVTGLVGPFLSLTPGAKRRTRQRFTGTVIGSSPDQQWMVKWDDIGKVANHPHGKLRFLAPALPNALKNVDLEALRTGPDFVKNQAGIDAYLSTWVDNHIHSREISINSTTVVSNTSNNMEITDRTIVPTNIEINSDGRSNSSAAFINSSVTESETNVAPPVEGINPSVAEVEAPSEAVIYDNEEEEDPDLEEMENNYDINELSEELAEDDRTGRHLQQWARYLREKANLIGESVSVRSGRKTNIWRVINNIKKEDTGVDNDFKNIGINGFDFNHLEVVCPNPKYKRINFLKLMIHLWPGDWKKQLQQLNKKIESDNKLNKINKRHGRARQTKHISEREFWKFWGLILIARIYGRVGDIWDRETPEGIDIQIDASKWMTKGRFDDIRKYISFIFANWDSQTTDPWWQVAGGVEGFNDNRKK